MNDRSYICSIMGNVENNTLIVGAGPTGLTLAIELARFGLPVRIVDKGSQPAQWSQALVVQARTLEQFARYGIADRAVEQGHPVGHAMIYHRGLRIAQIATSRIHGRFPFVLFLPQNETEQLLLEHLESLGVTVERNTELVRFVDTGSGGTATLRHAGGSEEELAYRWLAGCDGAHSAVRHALQVPFEGDTVGLRFFLGDLKLQGDDVPGDGLVVHLRHGDVLFLATMRNNLTRLIAVEQGTQDADADRTPDQEDFQRWIDEFLLKLKVEEVAWSAPFHINQRKARHYRQGSVFLAGDASHIHSPVAGQGMNTGIQDAANLAWKLAAVVRGAPPSLLDSYNEERGAVGDALLATTSRGLAMATTSNPLLELLRDVASLSLTPLPWVQQQVADFVSETAIHYRVSSIVSERGGSGSLRAGDRVPNPQVMLPDGTEQPLLAALNSAQHLLIMREMPDTIAANLRGVAKLVLGKEQNPKEQNGEFAESFGDGRGIWLVRPDGYLGFRGNELSAAALDDYARRVGIAAI